MAQTFRTGDVVFLKSGSPKMTVDSYEAVITLDGLKKALQGLDSTEPVPESVIVICRWIDDKGKQQRGRFHQDMLEPVK